MLDDILPLVKKPIRYTGGEYNSIIKTDATVQVGIVFPEVYEIGMSNLGIRIIYHLFNRVPAVQCERVFAPWPDFGQLLQSARVALYGLESGRSAAEFDLLGFSLQSELEYTNVLYCLELAGIPLRAEERAGSAPLLIAGGPATLNPRPLSPVFDAFVIGDGEEVVPRIAEILVTIPRARREERMRALAQIPGVWAPAIQGMDVKIKKQTVPELSEASLPLPPILPIGEIVHDRLGIEVMRGCMWGCRFCQSGCAHRPLRIRPQAEVLQAVERGIRETGWDEVSLLSFSILDYPDILNLIRRLNELLRRKNISISLPAMRGELFTAELAALLKEIKKTGLTFAPETASDALRQRINKPFRNERMVESIAIAHAQGWRQVKLYLMIGLPFERDQDIDETGRLLDEILRACPRGSLRVAVSPFVPKPHTPFESCRFAPLEELNDKIARLKRLRKPRMELKYQAPEVSRIEAILSRGDERLYPVIESVYRQGGKFEEWREGFDETRWRQAFEQRGLDPEEYLVPRAVYPWDIVDVGVTKEFLAAELKRAEAGQVTENCFYGACSQCGACPGDMPKHPGAGEQYQSYGRFPKRTVTPSRYRVKYSVGEPFRYASHLDMTRTIYRALRRTDLELDYSAGFSPVPRVSFSPPKSVGQISRADYFDLILQGEYLGNLTRELNTWFPVGVRALEVRALPAQAPSLSSTINLMVYEVPVPSSDLKRGLEGLTESSDCVVGRNTMKKLSESLERVAWENGVLTCGLAFGEKKVTIYELLAYLTGCSPEEVKKYPVTRNAMFIKKDGLLFTPMEEKW